MAALSGDGTGNTDPATGRRGTLDLSAANFADSRDRLGATLDTIAQRLRAARVGDDVMAMLRDAGTRIPAPMLESGRRNPLPLLLVVGGVIWLGIEVWQDRRRARALHPSSPHVGVLALRRVAGLVTVCRRATVGLRRAADRFADPDAILILRRAAEERGLAAAVLQGELNRFGAGTIRTEPTPETEDDPWMPAASLPPGSAPDRLAAAILAGDAETLRRFRAVLGQDLPGGIRTVLRARLRDIERTHERLYGLGRTTTTARREP